MLINIHNKAKGWFAYLIVGGIAVVFLFWGVSSYVVDNPNDRVVAEVNGQEIPYYEYYSTYQQLLIAQENYFRDNNIQMPLVEQFAKEQALESLIHNKVMLETIKQAGFAVSDNQLNQEIFSIPQFQVDGQFSPETFQEFAARNAYTPRALRTRVSENFLLSQLPNGLSASAFVLKPELERIYRLAEQKRDIGYMVLSSEPFLKTIKPSDEQTRVYYDEHQEQFVSPEQVQIEYLELTLAALEKEGQVQPEEVKDYYNEHIADYTVPELRQARHILVAVAADAGEQGYVEATKTIAEYAKRIRDGEDFAKLAAAHSDDPASAEQGGDVGWFTLQDMDPDFAKAAFALTQDQPLSQPIRSNYGVHLIELENIKPEKVQSFDVMKTTLENQLNEQATQRRFSELKDELDALSFESSDSLKPVAEQLNLPLKESAWFARSGETSGISSEQNILEAAFSDSVLQEGNNSSVIELDPNTAVVLRIKGHKASKVKDYSMVQEEIKLILRKQTAHSMVKEQGEAIAEKLNRGDEPKDLAKVAGTTWQQSAELRRNATDIAPQIRDAVFQMPRPTENGTAQLNHFALPNGDYVVVALKAVYDGEYEKEHSNDAMKSYHNSLQQLFGSMQYKVYTQAARGQAKVDISRKNM